MLVGETTTLRCRVRPGSSVGNVVWADVNDGGVTLIFFGMNPGSNPKYNNFAIDSTEGDDNWDLTIHNVEAEDRGSYACQNTATDESDVAERIVESKCILLIHNFCMYISF